MVQYLAKLSQPAIAALRSKTTLLNVHLNYPTSPLSILQSIWRNRSLIFDMTRREIKKKYQGTFLGLTWAVISPLLMLSVYTFVFAVVFKSRWGTTGEESRIEFAITLFAGLIVFGVFSESLNQAPGLIIGNVNYVKRVIFPLEILSIVSVASVLFNTVMSVSVLLLMQLVFQGKVPFTVVFFPVIVLPLSLLSLGVSWFFSALAVYIRDIGQLLGFFTTILFYTSAVFFPLSALPDIYQKLLKLNPLVLFIEQSRDVLIYGNSPDWMTSFILLAISSLTACVGYWWFQKTRKGFADVI